MIFIDFYCCFIDFYWFFIDFYWFCCYLQYFVGVMAILLGSGAPKINFYCYLHYFNIRSTDAIYFFFYWISLIWFFYLDFSYWTVLLDFDYHHVLDLGTFEKPLGFWYQNVRFWYLFRLWYTPPHGGTFLIGFLSLDSLIWFLLLDSLTGFLLFDFLIGFLQQFSLVSTRWMWVHGWVG